MIYEIIIFLAIVLIGLYIAWLLGGRGIENVRDWLYYTKEGQDVLKK